MAEIPGWFLRHRVIVETQDGEGAYGDSYADPVTVRAFVASDRKLIRNAAGAEVIAEVTIATRLADIDKFVVDSKVTLPWPNPDGSPNVIKVQLVKRGDDADMGGWQHAEVYC